MRTLGKYQLVAEIARGGMGIVYLAVVSGLGRFNKLFVVKELKPELVDDAAFLDMFLEEARLAARLTHPNIVQTYEVGVEGNRPYIVMDYLDGQTLARCLKKRSDALTLPMKLRVLVHALEGLQYAHTLLDYDGTSSAVVHRDMSPQNVFITFDGQVKIVDFGIAKAADSTVETRTGVFKGKPAYMAPEQLESDADPRADIFSIGVILWELLAKARMWPKKSDVEIMAALLRKEIPSIDTAAPDAPEELRRICNKALAPLRDDRYATAAEMQRDLEAYLESIGDRTSTKEIGQIVATLFEEQRASTRQTIERAISDARADDSRARLPTLTMGAEESSTGSGAKRRTSPWEPTSSSFPTPSGTSLDSQPPRRTTERTRLAIAALLAAGVTALALLVLLRNRSPELVPDSHAEGTSPRATTEAPPSSPPAAATETLPEVAAATPAPTASASAAPSSAPAPAPVRPVAAHPRWTAPKPAAPPPPPPASSPPPAAPAPAEAPRTAAKTDCNPPFYYEGTKKIFKPGCL